MGREEQSGGILLHKERWGGEADGVSREKDERTDRCGVCGVCVMWWGDLEGGSSRSDNATALL